MFSEEEYSAGYKNGNTMGWYKGLAAGIALGWISIVGMILLLANY